MHHSVRERKREHTEERREREREKWRGITKIVGGSFKITLTEETQEKRNLIRRYSINVGVN